jgi:hypothetical protein
MLHRLLINVMVLPPPEVADEALVAQLACPGFRSLQDRIIQPDGEQDRLLALHFPEALPISASAGHSIRLSHTGPCVTAEANDRLDRPCTDEVLARCRHREA